jgi:hypothetical protein
MMRKFETIARKIAQPPGGQNFARLNALGDEPITTSLIANFALSIPAFNYIPAMRQCTLKVQMGLELETALRAVRNSGSPAGREQNASFVEAFFGYDEERRYSGAKLIDSYHGQYRVSRDVSVPTKPTFTILEKGHQVPVILCGWKHLALCEDQIRLWLTILESGLFSYGDYRRSPAEILLFPEEATPFGPVRQPLVIARGDFSLLSDTEMKEQAELYVRAQAAALPLAEQKWKEREQRRRERGEAEPFSDVVMPSHDDLFGGGRS